MREIKEINNLEVFNPYCDYCNGRIQEECPFHKDWIGGDLK